MRRPRLALSSQGLVIVDASSIAELQAARPALKELSPGVSGTIDIHTPVGFLGDFPGAERIFSSYLSRAGLQVTDVSSPRWDRVLVQFRVPEGDVAAGARMGLGPVVVILVLAAIAAALLALGWAITRIVVSVDQLLRGPGLLVVLGVLGIVTFALVQRGKVRRSI